MNSCNSLTCTSELCWERIIPANLIQIQANSYEMKQRMLSLIDDKRSVANKKNELEFFNEGDERSSCARVDALLKCRGDSKSHLEVCQVWNAWGPQTAATSKSNPTKCSCSRCLLPDNRVDFSSGKLDLTLGDTKRNLSPQKRKTKRKKKVYTVEEIDQKIKFIKHKIASKEKT